MIEGEKYIQIITPNRKIDAVFKAKDSDNYLRYPVISLALVENTKDKQSTFRYIKPIVYMGREIDQEWDKSIFNHSDFVDLEFDGVKIFLNDDEVKHKLKEQCEEIKTTIK